MNDIEKRSKDLLEWKAHMPNDPTKMTESEVKAELLEIKKQINSIYLAAKQSEKQAAKLLHGAIFRVKKIGDLLWRVTDLCPRKFRKWVEKNFKGGYSTARHYKWLAHPDQWNRLVPHLNDGSLSIRKADAILNPKEHFKPPANRSEDAIKKLTSQFQMRISGWREKRLVRLANDFHFMEMVESTAKERSKQIIREEEARHEN